VEHLIDISSRTGIIDKHKQSLLIKYAEVIFSENKKYNLTGHKTLTDIIENLITGSLEPLLNVNVPRGTLFADLGTGSGIPGVPFAVKYSECSGILFDSNQKKIRFINKTATDLGISNVKAIDLRVEDAGRDENYRSTFDLVITRAMSDIYTIAELGAPLLKTGGNFFLYVNESQKNFSGHVLEHLNELGLSLNNNESSLITDTGLNEGILLTKIKETDTKYPRRMPVITRMAMK